MADKYLLEDGTGGYQLEDASGVYLLEDPTNRGGGVLRDPANVVRWYQGDEWVGSSAAPIQDEDYWSVFTPQYPKLRFLYLPQTEEFPVLSAPSIVEEIGWIPRSALPKLRLWIPQEQDEIPTTPATFNGVEDYWQQPVFQKPKPIKTLWQVEDERPTPPTFTPNEEDWVLAQAKFDPINSIVWAIEEDIVPQPAASSIGGGVLKDPANVVRWYQGDDIVAQAASIVDEDYWFTLSRRRDIVAYAIWHDTAILPATTIDGTSSTTNNNDTSSASGSPIIVGTAADTNNNDTSTASGSPIIEGSGAATNNDDTSSASGSVGGSVSGSGSPSNNNDTSTASGSPVLVGSSATTNANDTSDASGTSTIGGTAAAQNNNDTASAFGVNGTITITLKLPLTGAGPA